MIRYEAQPTRMFGSYSVTAHYDDGSSEALTYGDPHYCLAEAGRRNAALAKAATVVDDATPATSSHNERTRS